MNSSQQNESIEELASQLRRAFQLLQKQTTDLKNHVKGVRSELSEVSKVLNHLSELEKRVRAIESESENILNASAEAMNKTAEWLKAQDGPAPSLEQAMNDSEE